jgi:AcrR family transcriptional regulator
VPPNSSRRLLEAAAVEFSERGLAGARVAQISARAKANKQLIYAYFGDKEQLFDAVFQDRYSELNEAVPLDPYDLPGWVLALFDYVVANPALMRLNSWQELERPEHVPCRIDVDYKPYVALVAKAQREGAVNSAFTALDLIVMLAGLAQAWYGAFAARLSVPGDKAWTSKLLKSHRDALLHAAQLLVAP